MKNDCSRDEEIERTDKITDFFDIKNGRVLTQPYFKSDVFLLPVVFEKLAKKSVEEFDINPLYFVSLPGYTWRCGLKYTRINI